MDLFESKSIKPMLIGAVGEPFDSPEYIYELKLDGERCIVYLDKNGTEIRNKRNLNMNSKVPELSNIHKQVKYPCILDGELIVIREGKPDFYEIQRRSLMSNSFKIDLAAAKLPASFTAFDILYYKDKQVIELPLIERKSLLQKTVKENSSIAVSRYIEEQGIAFYHMTVQQDLEGIVAKRKDSKYYLDKRTKDWIKIKNLQDDDYVICGYILKENGIASLILGQYQNKKLIYKGHVTLGVSGNSFEIIAKQLNVPVPPFKSIPLGNENAIWISPELVCIVKYMMKTASGSLRQPVFKGLRYDKEPQDCIE